MHRLALTLAEGIHELGKRGSTLDLEKDLVVVIGDLDVQVFRFGLAICVASSARGLIAVRHFGELWLIVLDPVMLRLVRKVCEVERLLKHTIGKFRRW